MLNSKRIFNLGLGCFALSYALAKCAGFEYTGHTESPFLEHVHPAVSSAEEPKPALELRGISVENGVPWLTFYDSTAKKWLTGKAGDVLGDYQIDSFDLSTGRVGLLARGKSLVVFYKGSKADTTAGSSVSAVASAEILSPKINAPPLSSSEAARLDQVSSLIRQQIALQELRKSTHSGS